MILFNFLSLISLIVFSNVVSGSNFTASKLLFILSGSIFLSKDVIYHIFMIMEVIPFKWLALISLIVFSNVGSGSNFTASKLLFILSWSKLLSKDVVTLVISNFYGSLADISLITLVASERHSVFELGLTTSSICHDSWSCCYMKSAYSSSGCFYF